MNKVYKVGRDNNKIHNSLSRRHRCVFDVYHTKYPKTTAIEDTFVGKDPTREGYTLLSHSIYNYDDIHETKIVLRFPQGKVILYPGDFMCINNADFWIIKGNIRYLFKYTSNMFGFISYTIEDGELWEKFIKMEDIES